MLATTTEKREPKTAKATIAATRAIKRRYYVKYTHCEFAVRLGRPGGRFLLDTRETRSAGPFRYSRDAETAVIRVSRLTGVIPGSVEIVETEGK